MLTTTVDSRSSSGKHEWAVSASKQLVFMGSVGLATAASLVLVTAVMTLVGIEMSYIARLLIALAGLTLFSVVSYSVGRMGLKRKGVVAMNAAILLALLAMKVQSHDCLPWLSRYTDSGAFTERRFPKGDIDARQIGPWRSVTAVIDYEGTTKSSAADRVDGNPYIAQVRYDWIGPAAYAPHKVTDPKELDAWAIVSTHYTCEHTGARNSGVDEGSWVETLSEDGTATIRDAGGQFQDESPESKSTARTVKLEMPQGTSS